jgi:septal ring factor EnvC (AmiA/AmiB activator)
VNKTALCLCVALPWACWADSYDVLLKRYEKQIAQQERQLKSLRANLEQKEREALRWQKEAEQAKTQWTRVNTAVGESRRKFDAVKEKWKETRTQANAAEWAVTEQTLLSRAVDGQLTYFIRELYQNRWISPRRVALTVVDAAPEILTQHLCQLSESSHHELLQASELETVLRLEEVRWQQEQQKRLVDLDRWRHMEQSLWARWQDALRKRARLQEERTQMEQSSEALRVMLQEIREHRDHMLALRQGGPLASDRTLARLKGTLPWPAVGPVTQNFGRQYSSDLNQLLVSNGVRIEAGAGKPVRAVGAGKVLFAQAFRQYGQLVIIQHPNGLTSVYGGLGATQAKAGSMVEDLAPIGTVGANGSFYFELRREEEPLNPLVYLAPTLSSDLSTRRKFK